MMELVNTKTFYEYSEGEMEEYIIQRFGLKDRYLIGRVKSLQNNNYFIVEELRNPLTGKRLDRYLSDTNALITSAICPENSKEELNDKLVIFRFEINKNRLTLPRIKEGNPLSVTKKSVSLLKDASDALEKLDIKTDELFVEGLAKSKEGAPGKYEIFTISDFYNEIIINILEDEKIKRNEQIEELSKKQNELRSKEEKVESDEKKVNKRIDKFEFLFPELKEEKEEEKQESQGQFSELSLTEKGFLEELKHQIYSKQESLIYEEATLRQFHTCLKTNQLIILSGPSGTGKTSLVSSYAEVINAQKRIIPVQPSWIDKQDLLGFYNPVQKQYVPSPLMDVIVEAKENKERKEIEGEDADLFLVCLDELNLAQIEYYLADILSVREQNNESIRLYSSYEYKQNMEEIEWFFNSMIENSSSNLENWKKNKGINNITEFEYKRRYKNLTRFPPQLKIPNNIRFIGTINIDGSTKELSPKVIDRSYIIPVEKQEKNDHSFVEDKNLTKTAKEYNVIHEINADDIENLQPFLSILAKLEVNLNHRIIKHINQYKSANKEFDVNSKVLLDEIFMNKILPKINIYLSNGETELPNKLLEEIERQLSKNSLSYRKVSKMVSESKHTRIFSYWG